MTPQKAPKTPAKARKPVPEKEPDPIEARLMAAEALVDDLRAQINRAELPLLDGRIIGVQCQVRDFRHTITHFGKRLDTLEQAERADLDIMNGRLDAQAKRIAELERRECAHNETVYNAALCGNDANTVAHWALYVSIVAAGLAAASYLS